MRSVKLLGVTLLFLIASSSIAQTVSKKLPMRWVKQRNGTVCFGIAKDANTYVPPPAAYLLRKKNPSSRVASANIKPTFVGFESAPEAQAVFQAAIDIWESLLTSPVQINLTAQWSELGAGVLGSAAPATFYINFDNAQREDVWYPVALAEKIAGKELNPSTDPDIVASFNSAQSAWYYGTDGNTPSGKYDLMSVVLHEIGHGLGIDHSYEVSGTVGDIESYFGVPNVYETFLENQSGQNLMTSFTSPSTTLRTQLVSGNLYFNSTLVLANNSNKRGRIYAPGTYTAGSSIAHLDEATYPQGNINSLMTPIFNSAEAIHNPGPITMGILKDMGWIGLGIQHTPLPNTEAVNNDFVITCQVSGDTTYDAGSVKLSYTVNGGNIVSSAMQATVNPNEFSTPIPKPTGAAGTLTTYQYYLSVTDGASRVFNKPGLIWTQGSSTESLVFQFQAGPDSKPPHISHDPIGFVKDTDTQMVFTAKVSDNIGVQGAVVQYSINKIAQSDVTMINTADSTYSATLSISLSEGDTIRYRIKATDSSVEHNVAYSPAADYYVVNVVSLAPTQVSYSNNFNKPTTDFFGDASFFSIGTATDFHTNSINSLHPYPQATDLGKDSLNYVYELRVPIKLKAAGAATLKYDEVVLVEPGASGSTWPSEDFYDYVVVEGSKDGGATWNYLAKGYDSRDQSKWLTRWNSSINSTTGNSTAVGDSTLYVTRTIDMTSTGFFKQGDVIVIRFRLFSDQLTAGWGWAIDNLKIQIDDTPPLVLHNQVDFITTKTQSFDLTSNVTDAGGLKEISITYSVNNQNSTTFTFPDHIQGEHTLTLNNPGLAAGDEIEYQINAVDSANNKTSLPPSGTFKVGVLNLKTAVNTYSSNFNTTNTDFVGNLFSVTTPTGFNDGAIHSTHPYPNGFGLTNTSDYCYILKTPIKIAPSNAKIFFDEIVIAQTAFGLAVDYVIVEGSKDHGTTWLPFLSQYSSNAYTAWQSAYTSKSNGSSGLYKARIIDMTTSGNFQAGDSVLVRFRLFADATTNAWGWAIDNLSIQTPVTGIEKAATDFSLYPNPASADYVQVIAPAESQGNLTITDMLGRQVGVTSLSGAPDGEKVYVGNLNDGIYIVKIGANQTQFTTKLLIKR